MEYIKAKTILSSYRENDSWFGNNYNMNIYKGCNHGCIYCDSRSECYHVENFDQVRAKENALSIIENELISKRIKGVVGTGAMSDPYNQNEKSELLTRGALLLIDKYKFGVTITTKSHLVTRDIDILKSIAKHSPVLVLVTITSSDDELCSKIEPNVSTPFLRFSAIKKLRENNISAGVLLMPVLPFLEDNEANIKEIINKAQESDALFIYPAFGVTLRQNQRDWYYEKLDQLFPGIKDKYIKTYGNSYQCSSLNGNHLWDIFQLECKKRGILYKMDDIIKQYKQGYNKTQLTLF